VVPPVTSAYRLLHAEGDRLPGVVCDRYAEHAVLALEGAAARAFRQTIVELLARALAAAGIRGLLLREGRQRERSVEPVWGSSPPQEVVVEEHGMQLAANLWRGQKTGLFLDHRESRRRVRGLSGGLRVLNLYAYTGGFSVAAGLGGAAEVTSVDSAAPALALAERSWALNDLPARAHHALCADVPAQLAALAQRGERFDLVIADPPSFAPSEAKKAAALESYAALHNGALGVLADGGYYLAASCSSHVGAAEFEASLREGARRSRAVLQLLERWGAPPDHPRLLAFPEGDYLKVALSRVHFDY
jgi:23S rRNA (cytosine1962-C5)-methyltransferase